MEKQRQTFVPWALKPVKALCVGERLGKLRIGTMLAGVTPKSLAGTVNILHLERTPRNVFQLYKFPD